MDEFENLLMPQESIYKDVLALIAEHSITMTDTRNQEILQELIEEELKIIKFTIEGSLILVRSELAEIKRNQLRNVK